MNPSLPSSAPGAARRPGPGSSSVLPRQLIHRGVVEASGFVIEEGLLGPDGARRRLLSAWEPGARVRRLERGYLLLLPAPRRVTCAHSPGTPLVTRGEVLLSAPLEETELEALAAGPRSAVLVRAGVAQALHLDSLPDEDAAGWLDLEPYATLETHALGELPPPAVEAPAPPPDVRTLLADKVAPPPPELTAVLASLQSAREGPPLDDWRPGPVARGLVEAIRWVARLLSRLAPASTGASGSRAARDGEQAPGPPRRSWLSRLADRIEALAARVLSFAAPLARLIGRRHAEYLSRMMEMFEQGDLNEALRHAVPLARPGDRASAGVGLTTPTPRGALTVSPYRQPPGLSSPFSGPDLYETLRRTYRAAFERLRDAGKIDEAAFVLAELLAADEEAVSFLESNGRLRLAAELAEARSLPPGLIVRQWLVAREPERALALARRTGAFADAAGRLDRTHPELAKALRLHWAHSLALAGDFAAAVEAVRSVPEANRLALEWADRGIAAGGPAGARLLVRRLSLDPASFPKIRERVLALCEDESADEARTRAALALALTAEPATDATRTLARALARAVLGDQALDLPKRLAEYSADRALVTDLAPPRPAQYQPLVVRDPPLVLEVQAWDSGTAAVRDLAMLPGGELLLALGEAGVRLVTRSGRVAAHFDQPAFSLVVADSGAHALALAPRGEAKRIARLDIAGRAAKHWRDARLDAFARDYDGSTWWVAHGDTVSALDAQAEELRALWQVTRVGGHVLGLARNGRWASFCVSGGESLEAWTYELTHPAGRTLRKRSPLGRRWVVRFLGIAPSGALARLDWSDLESSKAEVPQRLLVGEVQRPGWPVTPERDLLGVAVGEHFVAVALSRYEIAAAEVTLLDIPKLQPRASLVLHGTTAPVLRLQGEHLLVADERGRLLALDLERGVVTRDLRVSL